MTLAGLFCARVSNPGLAKRVEAALRVKVLVLTANNLSKVLSIDDTLRAFVPELGRVWIAKDEHQRERVPQMAAAEAERARLDEASRSINEPSMVASCAKLPRMPRSDSCRRRS